MVKFEIHPDYPELEKLIPVLQDTFKNTGTVIYKIRNEVKVIEYNGKNLCIKSFAQPNIINYFVYSFIRSSKAKRSYENGLLLLKLGIETPQPLAYVEYYNDKGFLKHSYYISNYEEHIYTMEEVLNQNVDDKETIIKQFGAYVYQFLHKNGILHLDFGGNNILVKQSSKDYSFSIIDLNRIRVNRKFSFFKGLHNLRRLTGSAMETTILADAYASQWDEDSIKAAYQLLGLRQKYSSRRKVTKKILRPFKKLFSRK